MSRNMRPPQEGGQTGLPSMRPKLNASSSLLTPDENEAVYRMLGRKCQTLNTAVVQIYKTEASAHSHWKKKYTGVVCFVKDNAIRSYFLRAFCLIKHEIIWEHELYDEMKINKARPFLLTFEGQDGHVGLNFVSEDECDSFYRAVDNTIETRNRKKLEKRNKRKSQMAPSAPLAPMAKESDYNSVQLRNNSKFGGSNVNFTPAPLPQQPQPQVQPKKFLSSLTSSNSKNKNKSKLNKFDIGPPNDFRHLVHVGWDANKGFDMTGNENDEVLSQFFQKAGVSTTQLEDQTTREFIYEFIQRNNVLETVKQQHVEHHEKSTSPPRVTPHVPTRHQHGHTQNGKNSSSTTTQRSAPPPPPPTPPPRQPPPPVPTTVPGLSRAPAPPSRPPPINTAPPQTTSTMPAPPPPPPPPSFGAPPPPPPPPPMAGPGEIPSITAQAPEAKAPSSLPQISDSRNDFLNSIRMGVALKKVDSSALSTSSGDSRSDLMSEIRMGTQLRPANQRELSSNRASDEVTGTDALADALRRALQDRVRVLQSSDDESESSANDDEWDD